MPLVALPIALSSFSYSPSLTQPLDESCCPNTFFFFFVHCSYYETWFLPNFPAAIHLPHALWPPEGREHWLTHLTKVFSIDTSSTPGMRKPEFTDMEEEDWRGGISVSLKFSSFFSYNLCFFGFFLSVCFGFLLNPVCMPIYSEIRKLLWISISLEPISSYPASNTGASLLSEEHTELP